VNVKVELTITVQQPGAAPSKRVVSLIASDGQKGSVRARSFVGAANRDLNVDVRSLLLGGDKVQVSVALQYGLPSNEPAADPTPRGTGVEQSVTLILESGKPMLITTASDPASDRQATVEVKATILR